MDKVRYHNGVVEILEGVVVPLAAVSVFERVLEMGCQVCGAVTGPTGLT